MSVGVDKYIIGGSYETLEIELCQGNNAAYFTKKLSDNPTVEKLNELLKTFPDYNLQFEGSFRWTALAVAIDQQKFPLIQAILDKEQSLVNARWSDGCEPYIVYAAEMDNPEVALKAVEEFVKRGADVNIVDLYGRTALFVSSMRDSHRKVTKFLVDNGAIIYKKAREHILSNADYYNAGYYSKDIVKGVESQLENIQKAKS